jgi:hypothetical protein
VNLGPPDSRLVAEEPQPLQTASHSVITNINAHVNPCFMIFPSVPYGDVYPSADHLPLIHPIAKS